MFYVRADANEKAGMGHIMRMRTLSAELSRLTEVRFISDNSGFTEKEAFAFLSSAAPSKSDAVLVDSYLVTNEYLNALRGKVTVFVMDDEILRPLSADGIINYNLYADEASYRELYEKAGIPEDGMPRLFLGPQYLLLRPEFSEDPVRIKDAVDSVLLSVGGADPENRTEKILGVLPEGPVYRIVCGALNPHFESLRERYGKSGRFEFYRNVEDMAGLMRRCDMAVSAGGTTLNELCASGLPVVSFALADNQKKPCLALEKKGAVIFAGALHEAEEDVLRKISDSVKKLISDRFLREELSEKAKAALPRGGPRRLAEALMSFSSF